MSIGIQRAFYAVNLPPTAKFVAITLAWHHNAETNRCDPSAALLAQETGLCERSVRAALKVIADAGHMTVRQRSGTTPNYLLHPVDPCSKCTPAGDAPLQQMHPTPASAAPPPLQEMHPTPAGDAPKQERTGRLTVREHQVVSPAAPEVKAKRKAVSGPDPEACAVTLPAGTDPELMAKWSKWQEYRQSLASAPRKSDRKAWTKLAAEMSRDQIQQYAASHGSRIVADRIATAISAGWQGLNLDKLSTPPTNGNHSRPNKPSSRNGEGFTLTPERRAWLNADKLDGPESHRM